MKCMVAAMMVLLGMLTLPPVALAQSSTSYRLTESSFNAAGPPEQGTVVGSTSYRMNLLAVGGAAMGSALSSVSYVLDGGFVSGHSPPGEVQDLHFSDATTLGWSGEGNSVVYQLYRDAVPALPGSYGGCLDSEITALSTIDATSPGAGEGWFYLVTGRNNLGEEGTRGQNSWGVQRPATEVCP